MTKLLKIGSWLTAGSVILLFGTACSPIYQSTQPKNLPPSPTEQPTTETPTDNGQTGVILDLSNQGLAKLPAYVLERTNLTKLDISNNKLTGALPAEIRFLKNLKILDASYNQMTGVPAEVGQLTELTELNLSYNQLTGLPYELGNLKNLKILNLKGNSYSEADLNKILEGIPNVTVIK